MPIISTHHSTIEEAINWLHFAGWSVGCYAVDGVIHVDAHQGEDRIQATGATELEALVVLCGMVNELSPDNYIEVLHQPCPSGEA